jgi:hypothetical protein
MATKEPESPWADPYDYSDHELLGVMATALNRIAVALESIDSGQRKTHTKRIVLKARGRR